MLKYLLGLVLSFAVFMANAQDDTTRQQDAAQQDREMQDPQVNQDDQGTYEFGTEGETGNETGDGAAKDGKRDEPSDQPVGEEEPPADKDDASHHGNGVYDKTY